MRVYVAAKSEEAPRARALMTALESRGHVVTHDWTRESAEGLDGPARIEYLRRCAFADVEGVVSADALVIICHPKGSGQYTELGIAIGLGKPIIVMDRARSSNIFLNLPIIDVIGEAGVVNALDDVAEHIARQGPSILSLRDYEDECRRTMDGSLERNPLAIFALGIAGEAGEVADLIKKKLGHGHTIEPHRIVKELGDVLWYTTALAVISGSSLAAVANMNVEKLRERYPDGFSPERSQNREE